jgi:ATP adenylyltransferase
MNEHLYAPWRDDYIDNKEDKTTYPNNCVFCHISTYHDNNEVYVLDKDEHCFIVMNRYPYTPGHFMIIPHYHTDSLEDLNPEVWIHITLLAQKCVKLLKEGLNAHGVNLGMNLGKAGGAGIAEHIHLHLVPRWSGDTNFITSIAGARVYSTDFEAMYQKILSLIPHYISNG